MKSNELNTSKYWEERLESHLDLRGTGHRAFNLTYNRWLYQAQQDCLDGLIRQHDLRITRKQVLDIGSGTGFYISYFLQRGASPVFGVDVAETSIGHLQQTYPEGRFFACDISSPTLPFQGPFDLISAISVLYHIVDDVRFGQALDNMCALLGVGGYLLISDTFRDTLLPQARHARFRDLKDYEQAFRRGGVRVIQLVPIYFALNRTFVPFLGPLMINALDLGRWFYRLDTRLRVSGRSNGSGMKLLLAQRETCT
jgi:SAM-dependent methyltransferase